MHAPSVRLRFSERPALEAGRVTARFGLGEIAVLWSAAANDVSVPNTCAVAPLKRLTFMQKSPQWLSGALPGWGTKVWGMNLDLLPIRGCAFIPKYPLGILLGLAHLRVVFARLVLGQGMRLITAKRRYLPN